MALVVDNLKKLVDEGKDTLPPKPLPPRDQAVVDAAQRELDKLDEVRRNLDAKLKGGNIRSVPGLKSGQPKKKYRHNGDPASTPTAAYCDDVTFVYDGKNWVPCPEGDIIVDSGVLDPGNGKNIDETTLDGWKWKWTLLHVLVHEKMHEIMVNEQIERLKQRPDWAGRSEAQKRAAIQKARQDASTPNVHQQVYEWQKNALRWERRVLESRLAVLLKQKPPAKQAIQDLRAKIEWLRKQVSDLEDKMRKATGGEEFAFARCNVPGVNWGELNHVYVATDGLYWRLDVRKRGSNVVMSIGESNWLGVVTRERPLAGKVARSIVVTEGAFSAARIQPDACAYLLNMARPGDLRVAADATALNSALTELTGIPMRGGAKN